MNHSKISNIYLLLCAAIIAIVSLIGYAQRQTIHDWLVLLSYKPPAAIKSIADQDGMTAYTRRVFYVNNPQLVSRSTFSKYCPDNSEQSVVLGCYHTGQHGIYLLSVTNNQLYGLEQVTAAYETLHAIYERLNTSQQNTLNSELLAYEHTGLTNQTVINQIADFKKTEPGGVLNEMTSLFGTEIQNLPPALEKFYAPYFTNRQTLLNFYDDYESAFSSRQQAITSYDNQLSALQLEINSDQSQLTSELNSINTQQTTLNNERASGLIAQYNAGVSSYNQLVNSYNSLAENTKELINQYNQIVDERNSIALEEQQLVQAITSTPQPIAK